MTETEQLLRTLLREAVPEPVIPARLPGAAAAQAVRIRRRRIALRGCVGVAALVAGGATWTRTTGGRTADTLAPAASTGAELSEVTRVRLIQTRSCDLRPAGSPTVHCVSTDLELHRGAGEVQRLRLTEGSARGEGARDFAVPSRLVVELSDGSTRTATPTAEGAGTWRFDLHLPPDAVVVLLRIETNAGALEVHATATSVR